MTVSDIIGWPDQLRGHPPRFGLWRHGRVAELEVIRADLTQEFEQ